MSRTKEQSAQNFTSSKINHIKSPSRIAQFSPFRRGLSHSQSIDNLANEVTTAEPTMGSRGIGNVSEVPNPATASATSPSAKASTPQKPPKPVGLRVKKAKALSISLLTGNSAGVAAASHDQGSSSHGATSAARKRQTRSPFPFSPPTLRPQHSDENLDESLPTRAQSTMGFYNDSSKWGDFEATDATYNKKTKLPSEAWSQSRYKSPRDELFVISTRSSSANTLGNASRVDAAMSNTLDDFKTLDRRRSPSPKQRSHSSLGMSTSYHSHNPSHPPPTPAAAPFLNPFPVRAQWNSSQVQSQERKKGTPSPLSLSSVAKRTSYFNDLNRGPNSAPLASASKVPKPASSPSISEHMRIPSISTHNALTSHIPSILPRSRTQSHATTLNSNPLPFPAAQPETVSPLVPPRHKHSKTIGSDGMMLRVPGRRLEEDSAHSRSSSPFEKGGGALQILSQQLGGIGAAVGKRGWDMMKSWNSAGPTSPLSPHPPIKVPSSASAPLNEATKVWIASPEPISFIPTKGGIALTSGPLRSANQSRTTGVGIFGKSLREGVVLTRLGRMKVSTIKSAARLSALDLGSEFSFDMPNIGSRRSSSLKQRMAVDRQEARQRYLPAVVVRCIEAIDERGVEEEGIYRLSGRSSHTAKLKVIFDNNNSHDADLRLIDIGPAELDLNSVCSLLKLYLRALPDLLLTSTLSNDFNDAVKKACGFSATNQLSTIRRDDGQVAERERQESESASPSFTPETQNDRIVKAIIPLMNRLPAVNWYLLREIAYHLGHLTKEKIVQKTKMTLSNLCLVLAPTLSLSVPMIRVLVQAREEIFGMTCPLPDEELDDDLYDEGQMPPKSITDSQNGYSKSRNRPSSGMWGNEWTEKRISMATVTDKRNSTSSMSTLQASNEGNRMAAAPALRITSDIYNLPEKTRKSGKEETPTTELQIKDDDDNREYFDAPPIAAQYLRTRSSSVANSIGSSSTRSSSLPYSGSFLISQPSPSTSVYSNPILLSSSTMGSSLPSSSDRDSPRTADDHWPLSVPNIANMGGGARSNSNSSGSTSSLASLPKPSSSSALDRPRPTTPNPMRFFSSNSSRS